MFQLDDPKLWVAAAFLTFVALAFKKIFSLSVKGLDDRAAKISYELSEAKRLHQEAEALLKQYKDKQEASLKEAESILSDARRDADLLREYAAQELKASLDARMKQAMDKIAQEEATAVNEVRNTIVDLALKAARQLIASTMDKQQRDDIVKQGIADISSKIH